MSEETNVQTIATVKISDNWSVTVQRGIPIPTKAAANGGRGLSALMKSMEVGDSFPVPRKDGKKDSSKFAHITANAKKLGIAVTSRDRDDDGNLFYDENGQQVDRVWRIE